MSGALITSPASSRSSSAYPSTGRPDVPGRTSPGWFEQKMWSASVEPMPSSISVPNRSMKRRITSEGQRFAGGDRVAHRLEGVARSSPASTRPAQKPGGAKKRVGRCRHQRATPGGCGGSGFITRGPPADSGKNRALPRPNAKNRLATE